MPTSEFIPLKNTEGYNLVKKLSPFSNSVIINSKDIYFAQGYFGYNGEVNEDSEFIRTHIPVPIGTKTIYFSEQPVGNCILLYRYGKVISNTYGDQGGSFIKKLDASEISQFDYKFDIDIDVDRIAFSHHRKDNPNKDIIFIIDERKRTDEFLSIKYEDNSVMNSYLPNKPFSFTGEKAGAAGDSITRGHISGSEADYNYSWFHHFCEKVGLQEYNKAIAGAVFTKVAETEGLSIILDQIKLLNNEIGLNNLDYLFIAGGTNDYGSSVDINNVSSI